jgi:hypothetical protein
VLLFLVLPWFLQGKAPPLHRVAPVSEQLQTREPAPAGEYSEPCS